MSRLEIRLNAFRRSVILQKQVIIIIEVLLLEKYLKYQIFSTNTVEDHTNFIYRERQFVSEIILISYYLSIVVCFDQILQKFLLLLRKNTSSFTVLNSKHQRRRMLILKRSLQQIIKTNRDLFTDNVWFGYKEINHGDN